MNRTRTLASAAQARGLHALLVALLLPVRGGGWLSRTPVDCSPRVVAGALRQHHWGSLGTLHRFSTQQLISEAVSASSTLRRET